MAGQSWKSYVTVGLGILVALETAGGIALWRDRERLQEKLAHLPRGSYARWTMAADTTDPFAYHRPFIRTFNTEGALAGQRAIPDFAKAHSKVAGIALTDAEGFIRYAYPNIGRSGAFKGRRLLDEHLDYSQSMLKAIWGVSHVSQAAIWTVTDPQTRKLYHVVILEKPPLTSV